MASRLRPETLEEVVGQQHIIGKDKLLYRAIKADKLGSADFLRTSGNRKNDAGAGDCQYDEVASSKQINATVAGKKDMEEVVKEAKERAWECIRKRRSCLSMRFTVSIRGSRTIFFRLWRTEPMTADRSDDGESVF